MRHTAPILLLLLLASCTYEAPLNDFAEGAANVLAGEVVFAGEADPSYAVVFVTPADDPMPPYGTGSPATFTTVSSTSFTGGDVTLPSAEWTATHVPDGSFMVTGFMDMDRDFHASAFGGALAGATCGDWVGAHVEGMAPEQLVPSPVSAAGGELVDGVTVVLASELTVERPAFAFAELAAVSRQTAVDEPTTLQTFDLSATAVHATWHASDGTAQDYDLEGPLDGTAPCQTAFLAHVMDADEDGAPDDHPDLPGMGLLDIWPRIGLTYLGEPEDTDNDSIPDAFTSELQPGEGYAAMAVVSPVMAMMGELPVGSQTLVRDLEILWIPGAVYTLADGSESTVSNPLELPPGAWAVTVIQESGQTWTLPNGLVATESTHANFDPASQWGWLTVH